MAGDTDAGEHVIVVLDSDFGERLRGLPAPSRVWIVLSEVNEPAVRALWAAGRIGQVTGMQCVQGVSTEDRFLDELPVILLHHPALSAMEVIGLEAGPAVSTALKALGFAEIVSTAFGFTAVRQRITNIKSP